LHQPGGQAHALGRVGERRGPIELLGLLPPRAVEITRGFLDQRHAFLEQVGKSLRTRELLAEQDRSRAPRTVSGLFRHTLRLTHAYLDMAGCGELPRPAAHHWP